MPDSYAANWRIVQIFGKSGYLLSSLLTLLILLPLLTSDDASPIWVAAILTLIVVAGPLSLASNKLGFYTSLILGLVMVTNSWLEDLVELSYFEVPSNIITVSFFLILAILSFRQHVIHVQDVSRETLIGAINSYICMGIMYAFAYFFLLQADPGAFTGILIETPTFESCVYLSFVTMTTLGYGDITPQTDYAAILTWTQALGGQLFIALTVARIVGLMVAKESS